MVTMNNVHSDALTVTQEAQHYILGILKKNNAKYFRISVKTSGCSGLAYDPSVVNEIQPEDILLTVSDQLQIAVDADAVDVLKGTTIDLEKKTCNLPNCGYSPTISFVNIS